MNGLHAQLAAGDVVILDGATGTELQRRGVPMHGTAWSASALLTHPAVVRELHADYIRAGASIITTNSFAAMRHLLEPSGLGDRFRELNTRAVTLAREAREQAATERPVYIAASISTYMADVASEARPSVAQARVDYSEQAEVLAAAGADLFFLEMIQDLDIGPCAVEAALATGLPVWVGFTCQLASDGTVMLHRDDEALDRRAPLAAAVEHFAALRPAGFSIMHTEIGEIATALAVLRQHWLGPVGAYAHSGYFIMPNWQFVNVAAPERYAEAAQAWVAAGAQIVGGCCGIGPEHIRLLRERLKAGGHGTKV